MIGKKGKEKWYPIYAPHIILGTNISIFDVNLNMMKKINDKGLIKDLPKETHEIVENCFKFTAELVEKREAQKKETWIKNIIRIQGHNREEAEKLYKKINK